MVSNKKEKKPKILILATLAGGYAGADSTGQSHLEYPDNTYILPVMSPVMFPPEFFLRAYERGIDGIIIMYSGTDSPYKVEADGTAALVNRTYGLMKERSLDIRRLRLAAICTVCVKPFLKEVKLMTDLLDGIGFVKNEITTLSGD
ncbi:MAG: hydrogenase iron-sulfur subunit [Chloroflexota bacterium]